MLLEKQVMILYAVINGYLDDVPVDKIKSFEDTFHRFMETSHPEIGKRIASEKEISEETMEALKAAITEFKQSVPY
jgi:F-type H+-transporting ATPase subunit alpha